MTVATGAEGLREEARCRQCGHAIGEGAEEDTQRPLGHAILDEAHEDPRGELHRRERQRHEKDGEDDRHHRHDRPGDRSKDDLGDLGIGTGRKQDGGNPGAQRRDGLFERRKHGAEKAERDGDQQRPHQKPAAQRIHCGAEQGKQSVRHDAVSPIRTRNCRPTGSAFKRRVKASSETSRGPAAPPPDSLEASVMSTPMRRIRSPLLAQSAVAFMGLRGAALCAPELHVASWPSRTQPDLTRWSAHRVRAAVMIAASPLQVMTRSASPRNDFQLAYSHSSPPAPDGAHVT